MLKSSYICHDCFRARQRKYRRTEREKRAAKQGREYRPRESLKPWTEQEDEALRDGATELPGRTKKAIVFRRAVLGAQIRPNFTADDIAFIKRHYKTKTHKWIGEQLGRSTGSIQQFTTRNGLLSGQKNKGVKRPRLTGRQRACIPAEVQAAVPRTMPKHIRDEIVSMMVLDALERRLEFKAIKDAFKTYRTRYYAMHPEKGAPLSLDTPLFENGSATLGDTISSDVAMWERVA